MKKTDSFPPDYLVVRPIRMTGSMAGMTPIASYVAELGCYAGYGETYSEAFDNLLNRIVERAPKTNSPKGKP